MELKKHVVKGMAWTFAEKALTAVFQMLVGLVLMNFLFPDDYGTIQILVVFTSVCSVFVDSGFSAALIRRKEVGQAEYSAVFFFNIFAACGLYLVLLAVTPFLASYYNAPVMRTLAPVLFLLVPVNSFSNIQNTILTRRFDFKTISQYTLWATLAGSCVAVGMAAAGCGIWSLLGQRLLTPAVKSMLLWIRSEWRPSRRVSFTALRPMLGYSSRLLLSDITNTVYANISELFIGKMYTKEALGYYNRGKQYKDMPVSAVISSVQNVTFPALSQLQDDPAKMRMSAHQVTVVMNFIIFPVMLGLIAVVGDFIAVFLPQRWLPVIPYFRILCLSGLFAPLSVVSYNILKIKSDGKLIFRLEIIKKLIATVILAITIPMGVKAIAWGQTVIFLSDAIVNMLGAGRYLRWTIWDGIRSTAPYLAMSAVMVAAVYGMHMLLTGHAALWAILLIEITAGIAAYAMLTLLCRPEGWREVRTILRQAAAARHK